MCAPRPPAHVWPGRRASSCCFERLASGDQRDPSSSSEIQVEPRRRLYNRGGQLIIILLYGPALYQGLVARSVEILCGHLQLFAIIYVECHSSHLKTTDPLWIDNDNLSSCGSLQLK